MTVTGGALEGAPPVFSNWITKLPIFLRNQSGIFSL